VQFVPGLTARLRGSSSRVYLGTFSELHGDDSVLRTQGRAHVPVGTPALVLVDGLMQPKTELRVVVVLVAGLPAPVWVYDTELRAFP
jgi:hypothetical protein